MNWCILQFLFYQLLQENESKLWLNKIAGIGMIPTQERWNY